MSKNTSVTTINPETTTPVITPEIVDIPEPINPVIIDAAEFIANGFSTTPPAPVVPVVTAPAKSLAYDINAILAAMPDAFTPALLDKCFNINDGGKTIRRHLRNHFASVLAHNHNDKWGFTKSDHNAILHYFASRYPFTAPTTK